MAVISLVAVVVILSASLGYVFISTSSRMSSQDDSISSLKGIISGEQGSISSLSQLIPDSTIMTIHYKLTSSVTYLGVTYSISQTYNSTLGIPYRSGHAVAIYMGGDTLGAYFNESVTFTSFSINDTGFSVASISPQLPQTVTGKSALNLTVMVNTPSAPYRGDLNAIVQATISIPQTVFSTSYATTIYSTSYTLSN